MKFFPAFRGYHNARVAPARERGLKYHIIDNFGQTGSRSREGAWIEISVISRLEELGLSRSREGAWIEMGRCKRASGDSTVAPARERGLK